MCLPNLSEVVFFALSRQGKQRTRCWRSFHITAR